MAQFLVKLDKSFYDGHGEEESGNEIKYFISDKEIFLKFDGLTFSSEDECDDFLTDEELQITLDDYEEPSLHEEDGYFCAAYSVSVIKITDEQAEYAKQVIGNFLKAEKEYSSLFSNFGK